MSLAERIQTLRKQFGLSQEKLAEEMEVSRQAVTKWENGLSVPSMNNLVKLSEIFNVPLEELAHGKSDEPASQTVPASTAKQYSGIVIKNLTLLGFILIGAASSGYYRDRFFRSDTALPIFIWAFMGFLGTVLLVIKDYLNYKKSGQHLFGYDLMFIFSVLIIPAMPVRHDFAMIAMHVFAVVYAVVFLRKTARSIYTNSKLKS
ncbi:MAG: helix-turn-helix domain-containing protein [Clostridiales bacterium]|nr:helix-turn-helix domain-containing protein [Clostridiales bacterium]